MWYWVTTFLAERGRFELPIPLKRDTAFRERRTQPLCDLSRQKVGRLMLGLFVYYPNNTFCRYDFRFFGVVCLSEGGWGKSEQQESCEEFFHECFGKVVLFSILDFEGE